MIYFALNRDTKRACILHGFSMWEEVQGAARCGIMMPDGISANGIGRCKSLKDFIKKANHSNVTILIDDDFPFRLTINPYAKGNHQSAVSPSIWRSWTGKRFIDGIECKGERFYYLSNDTYRELDDKIQNCPIDDTSQMLSIIDALNINVGILEKRIEKLESSHRRTANIASCLANGIQPD